jgi:cytochrome c2
MARTGALAVVAALSFVACSSSGNGGASGARIVTGGDSNAGARLIRHYGCGNCHTIPGIRGADALVGPPLIHWARRTYIAGKLANTPENLETWVRQPREVEPGTDMPDLGVTTDESRNIAAYLMSQR